MNRNNKEQVRQVRKRRASVASKRRTRNSRKGLGVAVVLVALLCLGGISASLTSCFLNGQPSSNSANTQQEPAESAPVYVSPYNFSNLTRTNGRLAYVENGVKKSQVGVDVSEFQGSINWNQVAADGIEFAIIRAGCRGTTAGTLLEDSLFETNLAAARAAGLQVGVYFYSQAVNAEEAQAEAEFVLEKLNGANLNLPIVFDHEKTEEESRTTDIDSTALTQAADAFCKRVEAAGYQSMLYGNATDITRYNKEGALNYKIWYAEYGTSAPTARFDFCMWQYTNAGQVDGISTDVDLSIRFTDFL